MERTITLTEGGGLHARPAAQLVQVANRYKETSIKVAKDGKEADGKSILGLMGLGAGEGSQVTFRVTGPDEEAAMTEILALFEGQYV